MSVSGTENQHRDQAVSVYCRFVDALNSGDLAGAEEVVDTDRWREICVGFTSGVIEWPESRSSMEAVWKGIPDLKFEPKHLISDGRHVVAVGTVSGRQSGRLFGAPATKRGYTANMFDYVRIEDGKIIDRIQQVDMFGQLRQLFGPLLLAGLVGLCALLTAIGVLIGVLL